MSSRGDLDHGRGRSSNCQSPKELPRLTPHLGQYFPTRLPEILQDEGAVSEEPACQCRRPKEMRVLSLGQEDPLEEGMATHCSTLVCRIPWTEEPGGLQSM